MTLNCKSITSFEESQPLSFHFHYQRNSNEYNFWAEILPKAVLPHYMFSVENMYNSLFGNNAQRFRNIRLLAQFANFCCYFHQNRNTCMAFLSSRIWPKVSHNADQNRRVVCQCCEQEYEVAGILTQVALYLSCLDWLVNEWVGRCYYPHICFCVLIWYMDGIFRHYRSVATLRNSLHLKLKLCGEAGPTMAGWALPTVQHS